jgi:hypothetical protein
LNEAFGRAHNITLNHIHLFPLISYAYPPANTTPAVADPDWRLAWRKTLRNALQACSDAVPPRYPSILMAHSSRQFDISEALFSRFTVASSGQEYGPLATISTIIYYDGATIPRGNRTYQYGGCQTDTAYLIDPSTYLLELIKHDLRIEAGPGDLSRLIAQQLVGVSRRGVYAAPQMCIQKVQLPDGPST